MYEYILNYLFIFCCWVYLFIYLFMASYTGIFVFSFTVIFHLYIGTLLESYISVSFGLFIYLFFVVG